MFRKMIAVACAAVALSSAAQAADFTGARVGVNVGYTDAEGTDLTTYAVNAGYDFALNTNVVAGVTVELGDTDDTDRDISISGRVGGKVGDSALIYGHGGYTNLKVIGVKLDGYRLGAGLEWALTEKVYLTAEYRYSNYEFGIDSNGGVAGIGFRF